MDEIRVEARDLFNRCSQEVRDLTYQFFKSMDTNDDGGVDFQEIQSFFRRGNFNIRPYHQRNLFKELDQNHDNTLNFDEFITFFYLVFLRAYCHNCGKWLMGKRRRTCVDCFMSATHSHTHTYDLCRTCFHTFRYSHHHPRWRLKNYEEVIFNGNVPGLTDGIGPTTHNGMEPSQEAFRRLFMALQAAAAIATVGTAIAAVFSCTIL